MSDILVTKATLPEFDEYIEEIKDIWESHWLTNMGVKHDKLQDDLKKIMGVDNITLFANGHLALENVIAAFDFPKGGEVITTPFTFASTTHAIVRNGLIPVFCDINEEDYTIDVSQIENLITNRTVAILPVHVYGNICDVEKINEIAEKHFLKVIYDAAHAFGVTYKGESIGKYGDASMFSFHATKVFNTIEGGAVCYSDFRLYQILDDLKNFGIRDAENVMYVGGNAKMNEFSAAMGICNLKHFRENIEKRKNIVNLYRSRLTNIAGIKLVNEQKDVISNYAYFPVVFEDYKYTRDEILVLLANKNIFARKYFYPLTNCFECYKNYYNADVEMTPVAMDISSKVLTLPLYPDLKCEDVERICDIILK